MPTCSLVLTLACFLYGFTFSGRDVQAESHKEQCLYFIAFVEFSKDIFHITVCIHTLFLLPTSIPFHGITFYIPSCQLEDIWGVLLLIWINSAGNIHVLTLKRLYIFTLFMSVSRPAITRSRRKFPFDLFKSKPNSFPGYRLTLLSHP